MLPNFLTLLFSTGLEQLCSKLKKSRLFCPVLQKMILHSLQRDESKTAFQILKKLYFLGFLLYIIYWQILKDFINLD